MKQTFTIKKVEGEQAGKVIDFVMSMRQDLFPMLSPKQLPADLLHFDRHYQHSEKSFFLAAFAEDDTVLGTIGICPYDGRFDQLSGCYDLSATAEVVKCYINPNRRRLGLGTALFQEAARLSIKAGYRTLYLHTHPFLSEALPFWKAKGFEERLREADPVWGTIHMDKPL
ncbi:GNAT family N-acetyltransferase [Domibacillus robiginosus]|uniref:GNAT family N-acetyltransferase n=1 Tax=Domibacillus robiginosus TaxID=1071054 RepID=UPI00067CFA6C|nr:GNAT family N-acetyltransferase [Domibacillus robiginosus]